MALLTRYVDVSRGSNGDGLTPATAWNTLGGPNWASMNNANEYTVYLSGGVDLTPPTSKDRFTSADMSACTKLTLIGNWTGLNIDNPPAGTYILRQPNVARSSSFLSLTHFEAHLQDLLIDQVEFTGTSHPVSNTALVLVGKSASTTPCTLTHCGITERRANTGDTASKYPHTFIAPQTSVVRAINCIFRRKTPGCNTACTTAIRGAADSGIYGFTAVGCVVDNSLGSLSSFSPGLCFAGLNAGDKAYNFAAYNCIAISDASGFKELKTVTNCNSASVSEIGTSTSHTVVTPTQAASTFKDSVNGDYSLPVSPPSQVFNTGYDASALIGNYKLDAYKNDRSNALAGASWDRGPYEWGFIAPPYSGSHTISSISQINNPACIYYGKTVVGRALQVGDKISFQQTTVTHAWPVTIDAQGIPSVNHGTESGSDTFRFVCSAAAPVVWEPTPPAYSTWSVSFAGTIQPIVYTLAVNADNTQRTDWPAGNYTPPLVLPAPTGLTLDQITETSMRLNWTYPSSGTDTTSFEVQRWITGTSTAWETRATPASTARSHTETGLPSSTSIRFRVRAAHD